MNRKEAADLLPIIQAYAEGKRIIVKDRRLSDEEYNWSEVDDCSFNIKQFEYRIKAEPTYRPFKNAGECWNEMQKHYPFGWVTFDCDTKRRNISSLLFRDTSGNECIELSNGEWLSPHNMFKTVKFIDGSPFGIKEEE